MGKSGLLLLSILIAVVLCSCAIKRQSETFATYIQHTSYVRGGDNYWEFYSNGKRCEVVGSDPFSKVIGEKYIVRYDSLNPGVNYKINFSRPVFIQGEHTGKTICTVVKYNECFKKKTDKDLWFQYIVNGRYYEGIQRIIIAIDTTFCIKIGDQFEGEYWKENPKRVIIHIDKPIK